MDSLFLLNCLTLNSANIFPIFGLILATMGLYEIIEDNQVNLLGSNDAQSFEKFINGIASLNRAFQQVKFWEFTQPCLFLARALPYISTGRSVEGFLVSTGHALSTLRLYIALFTKHCIHVTGITAWNHGYAFH